MISPKMQTMSRDQIDKHINELRANTTLSLPVMIEKLRALRHGRTGVMLRLEEISYLDFRIRNLELQMRMRD